MHFCRKSSVKTNGSLLLLIWCILNIIKFNIGRFYLFCFTTLKDVSISNIQINCEYWAADRTKTGKNSVNIVYGRPLSPSIGTKIAHVIKQFVVCYPARGCTLGRTPWKINREHFFKKVWWLWSENLNSFWGCLLILVHRRKWTLIIIMKRTNLRIDSKILQGVACVSFLAEKEEKIRNLEFKILEFRLSNNTFKLESTVNILFAFS